MEGKKIMKLREWHKKEIFSQKMCIDCTEIIHFHEQACPKCTCTGFYNLVRLIPQTRIDAIDPLEDDTKKPASIIGSDLS